MMVVVALVAQVSLFNPADFAYADADKNTRAQNQHVAEIDSLQQQLLATPGDVDVRLAFAFRLSWSGQLAKARQQALMVIDLAPAYWDAHLLVARIDGWTGHYNSARVRVAEVLRATPNNIEALTLSSDIELWAKQLAYARERTRAWMAVDDSAAPLYRAAQIASEEMHPLETRRWARRALERDPTHRGAWVLVDSTHVVRMISITEFEFFPIRENSTAVGETFTATLFPHASWSVSAAYDYQRRFGTDNHRARVGVAHRINQDLSVDGFIRAGSVVVVPQLTASVGGSLRFSDHYGLSLRYVGEKMPWPGQFHRLVSALSTSLPKGFSLEAEIDVGLLRYCRKNGFAQGARLRGSYQRGWFRAGVRYGIGTELDRAPLPPFLADRFGDDVCRAEGVEGVDISLRDTRAQSAAARVGIKHGNRYAIDVGYGLTLRLTGPAVHQTSLSLRFWY